MFKKSATASAKVETSKPSMKKKLPVTSAQKDFFERKFTFFEDYSMRDYIQNKV